MTFSAFHYFESMVSDFFLTSKCSDNCYKCQISIFFQFCYWVQIFFSFVSLSLFLHFVFHPSNFRRGSDSNISTREGGVVVKNQDRLCPEGIRQVEDVFSIYRYTFYCSTWLSSNGFNSSYVFQFFPLFASLRNQHPVIWGNSKLIVIYHNSLTKLSFSFTCNLYLNGSVKSTVKLLIFSVFANTRSSILELIGSSVLNLIDFCLFWYLT